MSTIYVFYTKFSAELSEDVFANYFSHLPGVLQETNKRYLRWQDRTSNLLGKVMLLSGLKVMGLNFGLHDLKFNTFNKPFFDELFDFSISHSGSYVVCVCGTGLKLGVDIEEIRKIDLQDFKQVLSEDEFRRITCSSDSLSEFFKLWTMKESVAKANGIGLSLPLTNITLAGSKAVVADKEWLLREIHIDCNYRAMLAYDQKEVVFHEQELDSLNLLSNNR